MSARLHRRPSAAPLTFPRPPPYSRIQHNIEYGVRLFKALAVAATGSVLRAPQLVRGARPAGRSHQLVGPS